MVQHKELQEDLDPIAGKSNVANDDSGCDLNESQLCDYTSFESDLKNRPKDLGKPADDEELSSAFNSDIGTSVTRLETIIKEREYKIFYQSLEYPHNFTRKLSGQFPPLQDGNVPKKGIDATHQYHQDVAKWLGEAFNIQDADIVILGEYNDLRKSSESTDYKIVGMVGEGTRGMTVYCTTKRDIKGCRITTLDGEKIDIQYIDQEYKESRKIDSNASQERLLKLSKSAESSIGQCIEVMIHNRYMLFVHIKGIGDKARKNLLKSTQDYIDDKGMKYIFAGDVNAKVPITKTTQYSIIKSFTTKPFTTKGVEVKGCSITFCANTDSSHVIGNDESKLQQRMNIPGKTSMGEVCHDGIYTPLRISDRTEYSMEGSLWPIVKHTEVECLLGDHKGFLLKLTLTHSGRDSPTRSFTPSPVEDPNIDDARSVGLKEGKKSAATETSSEDEGVADLSHQEVDIISGKTPEIVCVGATADSN